MGRPSDYCQETVDIICERIANGKSVRAICRGNDMPAMGTVFRWLSLHSEFQEQYARARETQADVIFDEMLDIADTPVFGVTIKTDKDGNREITETDMLNHRRLQIDARKWIAGKLRPKKYGERITQENVGPDGGPMQVESTKTVIFLPRNGRD